MFQERPFFGCRILERSKVRMMRWRCKPCYLILTARLYRYLLPTYESDPLLTAIDDGEDNDDMDINLPDEEANQKYLQQAASHAQKEK